MQLVSITVKLYRTFVPCPSMMCGLQVIWVTSARYLGVYLESSSTFKCSFQSVSLFSQIKPNSIRHLTAYLEKFDALRPSEEVIFALMKSKCMPVLLYGTEACPVNSAMRHSLPFAVNRALLKYSVSFPKIRTKLSANTLACGLWRSGFLLARVNLI